MKKAIPRLIKVNMGIADNYGLNCITRDECSKLEWNKNLSVSSRSLRKQKHSRKFITWSFSLYSDLESTFLYQIAYKLIKLFRFILQTKHNMPAAFLNFIDLLGFQDLLGLLLKQHSDKFKTSRQKRAFTN
jgi:hypothetical protein